MLGTLIYLALLLVAGSAYVLSNYYSHQPWQPRTTVLALRRNDRRGTWRLPPPGVNLDLYNKTKRLLDEIEGDRLEALAERDAVASERDRVLAALDQAIAQRDEALLRVRELEMKVEYAKVAIRGWTHAKIEIPSRPIPITPPY